MLSDVICKQIIGFFQIVCVTMAAEISETSPEESVVSCYLSDLVGSLDTKSPCLGLNLLPRTLIG